MSMIYLLFSRCAIGHGIVGPVLPGFRFAHEHPVDAGLNVVAPDTRQAVREGQHDRDEQRAKSEQPQLRKGFRKAGLGEIDQQRSVDRAEDRHPTTDSGVDHHFDRGHDTDKGWRHEADLQRKHGAADGGEYRRQGEGKYLEIRDTVTGEADAVLLVAHRHQNAAEFSEANELRYDDANEQAGDFEEIQYELGVVGPDVPALQRAQIGDAVNAAGVTLLADDQNGQDRGDGLGDDGEIDAADPALEHRSTNQEGKERRNDQDGQNGECQTVERLPEERQLSDLIPVHEIGNAGGRLDLGVGDAGGLKLEVHRHGVTAEAEEHPLAKAEDAAISPAQDKADRDESVSQIFRDKVEAKDVQRQRQDDDEQQCQRQEADEFRAVEEARVDHGTVLSCYYFQTLSAKSPCGRNIRIPTIASSVITLAIDPDRKNSRVDCVCKMVKAEAMVPNRLAAPPNTTTRKVSTM